MAKGSNGKSTKRNDQASHARRQARWVSIIFLGFTIILILSMVLSLVK